MKSHITENNSLQFDIFKTKLKNEQKTELLNLLKSNRNVFSQNVYDLVLYTGTTMLIELNPTSKQESTAISYIAETKTEITT